jgi:hypothetical protein
MYFHGDFHVALFYHHQQNVKSSQSVGANSRRVPEAPEHSGTLPEHGKVLRDPPREIVLFQTLQEHGKVLWDPPGEMYLVLNPPGSFSSTPRGLKIIVGLAHSASLGE